MPRRAAVRRSTPRRAHMGKALRALRSLLILAAAGVLLWSLVAAPVSIRSDAMLPLLRRGDALLIAKWPYGWSRESFPVAPPIAGRLFARPPVRGDVVLVRNPVDPARTRVRRVIGLPGDRIALRAGVPVINGTAVPHLRVADLLLPETPEWRCRESAAGQRERQPDGTVACRYQRYRETLPGGRAHDVIGRDPAGSAGERAGIRVPDGHYFLLGDDRAATPARRFDASTDRSGLVPEDNLIGRAWLLLFSQDGSAEWLKPWTWWAAMRSDRAARPL